MHVIRRHSLSAALCTVLKKHVESGLSVAFRYKSHFLTIIECNMCALAESFYYEQDSLEYN